MFSLSVSQFMLTCCWKWEYSYYKSCW